MALVAGWGRTAPTAGYLVAPRNQDEAAALVTAPHARGAIARGLGRSYGDAAQNAGGTLVSTERLDRIIHLDVEAGVAQVEGGVSLDQLMRAAVPLGWWPPVTPGTRHVTVGGAIASDVHGKNHHRAGTFSAHVDSFTLATPAKGVLRASPVQNPEVFWATSGGMGLTGLILEATLRLRPIESTWMRVSTEPAPDLDALMERMAGLHRHHPYCVGWIDASAGPAWLGRSVIETADHVRGHPSADADRPLRFAPSTFARLPPLVPDGLVNSTTIALFNRLWYRMSLRRHEEQLVPLGRFFHPLDSVRDWNRLYGSRGLLQYQFAVPDSAAVVVRQVLEALTASQVPGALAVLKRFGPANPSPLSFPLPGWTLALDIPVCRPGARRDALASTLDRLDSRIAEAGGRIYLTKDSRLPADLLPVMYPRLGEWREVRNRLDPEGHLCSDLSRRLGLVTGLSGP